MIGPAGILALLIVPTVPPDSTDHAWATREATRVQPTSYHYSSMIEPLTRSSSLPAADETSPAGVAYAYDYPVTDATLQDANPFQGEGLGAIPPADGNGEPPADLPHDPAYQDGIRPPGEESPFLEEGLGTQPLIGEAACGDGCEADVCGGAGCSECSACAGDGFQGWLWSVCYDAWIAQGLTINTDSPRNRSNFPVTFNDRSNDYQMNQFYLLLERPVHQRGCGWDIGGRVDLLYGTDAVFTTARGLETRGDLSNKWNSGRYGLAMPQAYMEVYAPWWDNGLTLQLGHFYTILGYEGVPAVDNFFYSHSYAMQYGEPFTHTGLLGSTRLGELTFHAGMTRGWDNWEDNNNDFAFLGGVDWTSRDGCTSIAFAIHAGRERDEPPPNSDVRTIYSLVVQHWLSNRLLYVAQYDHAFERQGAVHGRDADWFGLNQYLFYTINPCWKAGMRFEWFSDEDAARIDPTRGDDYFALSFGFNWTPSDRIVVRPELRWDWVGTAGHQPFVDGRRRDQFLLDFDVIFRF